MIRLFVEVNVSPTNIERFHGFAEEMTAIVREKEPDSVMAYEFHAMSPDNVQYLVYEQFPDLKSYFKHMEILGDKLAAATNDIYSVKSLIIVGELPGPFVDQMKAAYGELVRYYGTSVSVLG
jgi:quinol monooxygenase YgiN